MAFAFTPDYAFDGSNTNSTFENIATGDEPRSTYGIKKVSISDAFLTLYFDSTSEFNTWRGSDHTITFDKTGSGSAEDWEVTNVDLTQDEEYSINTTYNYIHYNLSDLVGSQTNANDLADHVASNGTGSSVLDIEIDG